MSPSVRMRPMALQISRRAAWSPGASTRLMPFLTVARDLAVLSAILCQERRITVVLPLGSLRPELRSHPLSPLQLLDIARIEGNDLAEIVIECLLHFSLPKAWQSARAGFPERLLDMTGLAIVMELEAQGSVHDVRELYCGLAIRGGILAERRCRGRPGSGAMDVAARLDDLAHRIVGIGWPDDSFWHETRVRRLGISALPAAGEPPRTNAEAWIAAEAFSLPVERDACRRARAALHAALLEIWQGTS